ncbi:bifunctional riboflavin kinase/FAD synthetase [Aliikangiella maris]|uniref:Bifunctional riboflavin kinase/FAD synthetase n=3 Tax=Aliikangiella maris TaxID=3162458 RepID=A0ABV3MI77_9GAMM
MELVRGLINLQKQSTGCVATIGNFDGIHLGHQAIIERVIVKAKSLGLPACVLVFEPHPKEFFMGENCPPRLTCFREKYHRLNLLGVDKLVVLQFNQTIRQMKARDFVLHILLDRLQVKHLVIGDDFQFGHQRQGNYQLLCEMAQPHYTLEPTPSIVIDHERVSSTLIRQALANNEFAKVSRLLGREYTISGRVGYGQQIGRTIGFPTANVAVKRKKIALTGVFLVKCIWQQDGKDKVAWGAANCGKRPTVNGCTERLEVHLFGVSQELYGIELAVEFKAQIRQEIKFNSLTELQAQIKQDINQANQLINQFK